MESWIDTAAGYALPMFGAAAAGCLIGLEREFRGHPAGLRTHMLVSLASAVLMLAAVHQTQWMGVAPLDVIRIDPVRMSHGILTGIGFLCGGVIFRQGLSVHGLTTAASLWITSALGMLYGVGFYVLAVIGTVVTLIILAGFRWIDEHIPQSNIIDVSVRYRREGEFPEEEFLELLRDLKLQPRGLRHKLAGDGEAIEIGATLRGPSGGQTRLLARRLCDDGRVIRFEINPRND